MECAMKGKARLRDLVGHFGVISQPCNRYNLALSNQTLSDSQHYYFQPLAGPSSIMTMTK